MYNIYVTNKCEGVSYVRLSSEKMQYSDSYVQKMKEEILDKEGSETSREYISFLSLGGFCLIPPDKTRAFPVENMATSMYVSVVYASTVWIANFPFDPKVYGCIAITKEIIVRKSYIAVLPYNPEAEWFPGKADDEVPSDAIKAGVGRKVDEDEKLYFGRDPRLTGGQPCAVISTLNCLRSWRVNGDSYKVGDLLKNTGFELIRAKKGDPMPPNVIMTGVTNDGSLYVGRVGGSIPCHITTKKGKIKSFDYISNQSGKEIRVYNGEVMVLTR